MKANKGNGNIYRTVRRQCTGANNMPITIYKSGNHKYPTNGFPLSSLFTLQEEIVEHWLEILISLVL